MNNFNGIYGKYFSYHIGWIFNLSASVEIIQTEFLFSREMFFSGCCPSCARSVAVKY